MKRSISIIIGIIAGVMGLLITLASFGKTGFLPL
jgi:hypothetical protein